VRTGESQRRLLNDQRQLRDYLLIQRNAVVRLGRLRQDLGLLRIRASKDLDSFGLGLSGANNSGHQRLAGQFRLLLRQSSLGIDHLLLGESVGRRPSLVCLGLSRLGLGRVLGFRDCRLAGVVGLVTV
jgi:hypothetical protein